jgi:transcriptional regulator with PAS, ATPase and Fis domain
MTEPTVPGPDSPDASGRGKAGRRKPLAGTFHWQAFFRRSAEPVFVLDRRQRLLFVNEAWETLTGVPASEAHHLTCRRPRPAGPDDSPHAALEHALTPPPEARRGAMARVRRLQPGPAARWWDVEFLPLRPQGKKEGALIVGRVTPVAAEEGAVPGQMPERLMALRERATQRYGQELLAGESPAVRRLAEQVRLAARTTVPVLLVGEPGAGKETLARLIHYQGPDRERPFAALDCARLPAAALADVLFSPSRILLGVIYLREPGRLPRDLQLRLCGMLRGETEEAPGAPRIIAGCEGDPQELVRDGRLLDELYASLAVLTLHVPPLRERTAELAALVDRLLDRCNEEGEPHVKRLAPDVWDMLREYSWPGNLRELYAVLSAARRHAGGERITAEDVPASLRLVRKLEETPGRRPERPLPLDALLEKAERRLIEMALRRAGGKKQRAAEILSIWRMRLTRRMKALGIVDPEAEGEG